jgi:hypothetical protein
VPPLSIAQSVLAAAALARDGRRLLTNKRHLHELTFVRDGPNTGAAVLTVISFVTKSGKSFAKCFNPNSNGGDVSAFDM